MKNIFEFRGKKEKKKNSDSYHIHHNFHVNNFKYFILLRIHLKCYYFRYLMLLQM